MALISADGLIIKVGDTGNSDRICTIITRNNGVIRAFAPGAKNIKNKNHAATNPFTYSGFILFRGRDSYSINESDVKENFSLMLNSLEKLALAQYFGELCMTLAADNAGDEGFLRLTLNALHLLSKDKYPAAHIKAVTELRMLCCAGYMPDLVMCASCGKYEAENMVLDLAAGKIFCSNCVHGGYRKQAVLPSGVLTAMRYICYSPFEKIFSFSLTEHNLSVLSQAVESFLLTQLDRTFKTLDFYKGVTD